MARAQDRRLRPGWTRVYEKVDTVYTRSSGWTPCVIRHPVYTQRTTSQFTVLAILRDGAGHRVGIPLRRPLLRLTARRVKPARGRTHSPITDLGDRAPTRASVQIAV